MGEKRRFIEKIGRKFCFLSGKRCFINNFKGKAKDSAGQERLNCPLPGVKFIIYHCFQLFSISSLIISTYLRALEMS